MWGGVPIEVGQQSEMGGALFRTKWGSLTRLPTNGYQSISGNDPSAGPACVVVTEFAICNQRFSISSIRWRT